MSTTPTPEQFALAALVASGFVTQSKVDEALALYQDVALTQGAGEAVEPVATVVSWTNGSYSRNYKLTWHKDVPEGTKLYSAPPAQQLQQAVARARKDEQEIMHGLLRPVVVEAIRGMRGAPDIEENGKSLVTEIEEVFRAAIRAKGTHD